MRSRSPPRSTARRIRETSWSTSWNSFSVSDVGIRTQGIETIPASMPFQELIHLVARSTETLFPVVDGQGRLTGIFTLRDLRLALVGSEWGPLVLADDLAYRPVLSVTPEDNLHTALRRMTELNIDEIPVVDAGRPRRTCSAC